MSSEDSDSETPLLENTIKNDSIPLKSKERYLAVYETFVAWRKERNITSCSEEVLLAYFNEIATKYKPSTLWATYSMLKCGLKCNENVYMERYGRLTALLRRLSVGYVCKKAKSLTVENVEQFIDEAPDEKYLATKVALIFGVTGGLRRQELSEVTINDIEDHGAVFIVKIPHAKDKLRGSFAIQGKYYDIVKKYQSFRNANVHSTRFFQQFRDGKCRAQVIGKNKFGMMPKEIAEFLKLPDAKSYTGHSYRKMSSEKMPVDSYVFERCEDKVSTDMPDCSNSYVERCADNLVEGKIEIVCETGYGRPSHKRSLADSDSSPFPKAPVTAPVPRGEAQCRFCGDFRQCMPVGGKPYLMGEKTSLALNHLKVELDFSIDSLPKTICKDCDRKLLDTFEFIKQVNAAQFSLVSVCEKDISITQKDVNTSHVKKSHRSQTHTSKNLEIDTQIVKVEFESSDEDSYESQEAMEDSLPLSETIYLRESHKRKNNKVETGKKKKKKTNDNGNIKIQNTELVIDIKEERIDSDQSNDEQSAEICDSGDEKPRDCELVKSALDYQWQGDETLSDRPEENNVLSGQCND